MSSLAKLGPRRTVGLRVSSGRELVDGLGSTITGGIDSDGAGGSKKEDDDLLRWAWGGFELMMVEGSRPDLQRGREGNG